MSHKKEGRTVGVNFLMVQEWVIMHKWRDWPLLEAQRFHPKEQEGRLRCTCLDVGSRQWELGRSVLLIVSISTKKKKRRSSVLRENGGGGLSRDEKFRNSNLGDWERKGVGK